MTNQEYLRGNFFGAGLSLRGVRSLEGSVSQRIEYENGDFSFLLRLGELQRSQEPVMDVTERINETEHSIFEKQRLLDREIRRERAAVAFSLEEFERDMDLLAEGLENLPLQYRGTYSREDIYTDDE